MSHNNHAAIIAALERRHTLARRELAVLQFNIANAKYMREQSLSMRRELAKSYICEINAIERELAHFRSLLTVC